jgi:hypothetical protein
MFINFFLVNWVPGILLVESGTVNRDDCMPLYTEKIKWLVFGTCKWANVSDTDQSFGLGQ